MTIKDYFTNKVKMLNLPTTEDNLAIFLESKGLIKTDDVTDFKALDILFLEIILMVLAMPNVSEGDMSISYDRDGLMKFYKAECNRLNVEDNLSKATIPKVRDMSFLS